MQCNGQSVIYHTSFCKYMLLYCNRTGDWRLACMGAISQSLLVLVSNLLISSIDRSHAITEFHVLF